VSTFSGHKTELQFLISQRTAVTVANNSLTLTDVAENVDKIVAFLDIQSRKDTEAAAWIAKSGGEETVIRVSTINYFV